MCLVGPFSIIGVQQTMKTHLITIQRSIEKSRRQREVRVGRIRAGERSLPATSRRPSWRRGRFGWAPKESRFLFRSP